MFEYSSIELDKITSFNPDILNQMVLNDVANERLRKISLEPPLAIASMNTNTGATATTPATGTNPNALYFAKNVTTGNVLNVDNVINSPLSMLINVDRGGVYRFMVIAMVSSGAGTAIPTFQITDIDTNAVQEIGNFTTSGVQSSTTGHFYTPSILFTDRWLYGGKTYKLSVTTGLIAQSGADIGYINAYPLPPTIAYFWVQGYNGTGQQIEVPNFSIPSFDINIPDIEVPGFNMPDFDFPSFDLPNLDFNLDDVNLNIDFENLQNYVAFTESFNKGSSGGYGPDQTWTSFTGGGVTGSAVGTVSNAAGITSARQATDWDFAGGAIAAVDFTILGNLVFYMELTFLDNGTDANSLTFIVANPSWTPSNISNLNNSDQAQGLATFDPSFSSTWYAPNNAYNSTHNTGVTVTTGDVLRVEAKNGSGQITAKAYINGVVVSTGEYAIGNPFNDRDANGTAVRRAGLYITAQGGGTFASATDSPQYDNLTVGVQEDFSV